MTSSTDLQSTELTVLARRELAAAPIGDLHATLEVLERLAKLKHLGDMLQQGMEALTSLRSSQLMILRCVESGTDHPRHIGRDIGMDTGAVVLTLLALQDRGFVETVVDQRETVVSSRLTEAGKAILGQVEALQIRTTDALLQQAAPGDVNEVLDLLDRAVERVHAIVGIPVDEV